MPLFCEASDTKWCIEWPIEVEFSWGENRTIHEVRVISPRLTEELSPKINGELNEIALKKLVDTDKIELFANSKLISPGVRHYTVMAEKCGLK